MRGFFGKLNDRPFDNAKRFLSSTVSRRSDVSYSVQRNVPRRFHINSTFFSPFLSEARILSPDKFGKRWFGGEVANRYPFEMMEFIEVERYVDLMLQGRRDINARSRKEDTYQNTFLMHLLAYEYVGGAAFVLQSAIDNNIKVNPNLQDINGRTLLMQAILLRATAVIDLLLENPSAHSEELKINQADHEKILAIDSLEFHKKIKPEKLSGFTALHYAFLMRDFATAEKLLEAGADLTIRDVAGRTPEDLLKPENNEEIVKTLMSFGIDAKRDEKSISDFLVNLEDLPLRNRLMDGRGQPVRAVKDQIPPLHQLHCHSLVYGERMWVGAHTPFAKRLRQELERQIQGFTGRSLVETVIARTEEFTQQLREFEEQDRRSGLGLGT